MKTVPRIKICGITRKEDAFFAASLGVDALGFVFAPSPRQVTEQQVADIVYDLPPFVSTVGVFVNAEPDRIRQIVQRCPLDWIQLHGGETPSYCSGLGLKVLKAIRVRDTESLSAMHAYRDHVQGFVLDTYVKDQHGGTGKAFDWSLVRETQDLGPVILAGGLTPGTVKEALAAAKPYGVDVSSGVESTPGIKDHDALYEFVAQVKNYIAKENE